MSEQDMGKSCVHGYDYESAWLSLWTQRGSGFELQAHHRDAKINLPEGGQLVKMATCSMKLKGKMLSGYLDPFPNPGLSLQMVETIPDMNKEPTMDGEEGETSSSATGRMNVSDFLKDNTTNLFKDPKRIRLDTETNSRSQVKRLKTNASDYTGNETNGMMAVQEGPWGEKVNYFFHRIFNGGINKTKNKGNQEPFPSKIKNLKMGGGDEDFMRLNPWIHRLCKKKAADTHQQGGRQEVSRKRTALEKQFPSVAAMALMGKALRRFKPQWS